MTPAPPVVPVLVLGSGLTVLGVIRTLGRAGIPTYVVADDLDFVHHSRWFRAAPPSSAGLPVEGDLGSYLRGLSLERGVLMPCSDIWTAEAARLDPGLAERFPTSLAPASALEACMDKAYLARDLEEQGIAHPSTIVVSRPEDFDSVPDFRGRFLKPRDSQRFFRRFGVKAFRVAGREEAVARLQTAAAAGVRMLLQEYVPGPVSNHLFVDGFVDRAGRLCALFARRRLRMFPADFGNSTYQVSVALDTVPDAIATVERLVAALEYRGIFSCEFKYDVRDSLFKMLEVNARPWWYIEFAARCGVDVCTMAYRDALGLAVEPVTGYSVGRACVYPYYDYSACRELRRAHGLSLWSWARSWVTAEQPVLRWSDPLPAVIASARGIGRRIRKRMARPS